MSSDDTAAAARQTLLGKTHSAVTDLGYLLAGLCLITMAVLYGLEVVLRYFFNAPTKWSLETITFLMLAMIFLALPHGVRTGMHIAVTLIADISPRFARVINRIVLVLGVVLCGFIGYISLLENFRQFAQDIVTTGNVTIPRWWLSAFITYGFVNSALWYVRLLLTDGRPAEHVIGLVARARREGAA
ncbi:MAG: TRAP transporter small permease [Alphaproteobacteria bacterium]